MEHLLWLKLAGHRRSASCNQLNPQERPSGSAPATGSATTGSRLMLKSGDLSMIVASLASIIMFAFSTQFAAVYDGD